MAEQTFGQRLKQLRQEAGMTQQQLAEACEMHTVSISRLELDQYSPSWPTVQALARALGLNSLAFEETVEAEPADKQPGKRGRPRHKPADQVEPAPEPPAPEPPPEPKPRRRKKGE